MYLGIWDTMTMFIILAKQLPIKVTTLQQTQYIFLNCNKVFIFLNCNKVVASDNGMWFFISFFKIIANVKGQ